jgi:hypothetical protein
LSDTATISFSDTPFGSYLGMPTIRSFDFNERGAPFFMLLNKEIA